MTELDSLLEGLRCTGKPIIGCLPLYPPLELFHSMGFNPIILWGTEQQATTTPESDKHVQAFACSVGRRLVESVLSSNGLPLDCLFSYNACDTLRNLPEILAHGLDEKGSQVPFLHIHVPMNGIYQDLGAAYLKNQIETLERQLESIFGIPFSPEAFAGSIELYRKLRSLTGTLGEQVARGAMPFSDYAGLVQAGYLRPVEDQIEVLTTALDRANGMVTDQAGRGILLSGILPPPKPVCDAIEQDGLTIVANDIAAIHRSVLHTPGGVLDPGEYYVDFYKNHCPCPTLLYTADNRLDHLLALIDSTGATGVIFLGEKFCEYEYFEFPFIEKQLKERGINVLALETSIDAVDSIAPVQNRIDAFAELFQ